MKELKTTLQKKVLKETSQKQVEHFPGKLPKGVLMPEKLALANLACADVKTPKTHKQG